MQIEKKMRDGGAHQHLMSCCLSLDLLCSVTKKALNCQGGYFQLAAVEILKYTILANMDCIVVFTVHPKMKLLSSFILPQVVPDLHVEHQR